MTISATSTSEQNYKPEIIDGCIVLKSSANVGGYVFSNMTYYTQSYIVEATSNTITLSGNQVDPRWTSVSYIQID